MEFFKTIFSKENITFALACFGSFIGIYNFIKQKLDSRTNLKLEYKSPYTVSNQHQDLLALYLSFCNNSSLDITVTHLSLSVNNQDFNFEHLSHSLPSGEFEDSDFIECETSSLPLHIPGNCAIGNFFCINLCKYPNLIQDLNKNNLSVKITAYTNRKKSFTCSILSMDILLKCNSTFMRTHQG